MSDENDVPLGEDSRRYYEQRFADRIRKVSKGGGAPSHGSGKTGNAGCGIGVAIGIIFVVLRIVAGIHSSTPSYTYTPPPQPNFNVDFGQQFNEDIPDEAKVAPPNVLANDLEILLQVGEQVGDPLFTDGDVPFPQGLCYRIQQESRQPRATPGKRIWTLATAAQRALIAKAASGQKLSGKEQGDLRATWNGMLRRADFHDGDSFALVQGAAALVAAQALRDNALLRDPLFNRLLLEKCYPQQIIPLRQRDRLNAQERQEWRDRAQLDFNLAKVRDELKMP